MHFARCILMSAIAVIIPCAAQAQQRQAPQKPIGWNQLPRMHLDRQYAGPLQDTVIQRWSDPLDGTACYVYLPITAAHTPPTDSGYVQYGANTVGSISCIAVAKPANNAPAARPARRSDRKGSP